MKITLPTKLLSEALSKLKPVSKHSAQLPVLGNVALIADKKTLRLVGMDLEKRMEIVIPCKSKDVGSITLSCAYLADLLATRSEPECTIETKDKPLSAVIRIGRHTGTRPGLPIKEMPAWPESSTDGDKFTIPATLWNDSLTKCLVQANNATGERAMLNSVVLVSREGLLNIQATNGQRLIICYTPIPFDSKGQYYIPRESVPSLCSLATEGDIEVSMSEGVLTASSDAAKVSTKLIDTSWPDFEKVFPKERTQSIVCNREKLLMEIRSASSYIQEQPPKISLTFDGKELTVTGSDSKQQNGEGAGALDAIGDAVTMYLNPLYLTDALRAFDEEQVKIEFNPEPMCIVIKNDTVTTSIGLQKG